MPAIPESTRSSIILRLLDHAENNWPQLAKVQARYHGSFAYITGVLPGGEQIPLFRLRYGGSAHSFGFAIYSPARDRYEDAVLLTGLPIGSPQEALDTACTLHLAALGHEPESWPPTDLRCHPLSAINTERLKAVTWERTCRVSEIYPTRRSILLYHCTGANDTVRCDGMAVGNTGPGAEERATSDPAGTPNDDVCAGEAVRLDHGAVAYTRPTAEKYVVADTGATL